jgi:hypothetical protein
MIVGRFSTFLFHYLVANAWLGIRIEWSKSRARMERWGEDVRQVTEEMRRVLVFQDWKSGWWVQQGPKRSNVTSELREGLLAYANRQASVQMRLANSFADIWFAELARFGIPAE